MMLLCCYEKDTPAPNAPLLIGQRDNVPLSRFLLATISNHCLTALPAKMSVFNSHMRQNA